VRFVLGSGSPARLATLQAAGLSPEVVVPGIDEDAIRADTVRELVEALAEAKARAVLGMLHMSDPTLVLACDSLLELEGVALGKPDDAGVARKRWQAMRGRRGTFHTGHCLVRLPDGETRTAVASTVVSFANITDAEIDAYIASGEPMAVAGGFTIDGLGGAFVEALAGDPHNVIGVSLPLLRAMCLDLGVTWTDLWGLDEPKPEDRDADV
jgi:septum formation protein